MVGGYNVKPLIDLLDDKDVAAVAAAALKKTLLMFDFFHDVARKRPRPAMPLPRP
jgi:aconitate hydratase 2/2-methylisocitrate dehydratase